MQGAGDMWHLHDEYLAMHCWWPPASNTSASVTGTGVELACENPPHSWGGSGLKSTGKGRERRSQVATMLPSSSHKGR